VNQGGMSPQVKEIFRSHFEESSRWLDERARESSRNTIVKYRHLPFLIYTEAVFPACVLSYMHVCECSLYVVNVCGYHAFAESVFDFRLERSLRLHTRRV
jgi:hypothetical protein